MVQRTKTSWSCLAVALSYEAFINQASGKAWNPLQKATVSRPDPTALLHATEHLAGEKVSCVSIDIPLATSSITSQRATDTAITSFFEQRVCIFFVKRLTRTQTKQTNQYLQKDDQLS